MNEWLLLTATVAGFAAMTVSAGAAYYSARRHAAALELRRAEHLKALKAAILVTLVGEMLKPEEDAATPRVVVEQSEQIEIASTAVEKLYVEALGSRASELETEGFASA